MGYLNMGGGSCRGWVSNLYPKLEKTFGLNSGKKIHGRKQEAVSGYFVFSCY
jgi:hypothetical protein